MKIEIESFAELEQLVRLIVPSYAAACAPTIVNTLDATTLDALVTQRYGSVAELFDDMPPGAHLASSMDEAIAGTSEALPTDPVNFEKLGEPQPETGSAEEPTEDLSGLVDGERAKPVEGAPVDKFGTPLDERIHQIPGKLNGDGSWRARRGLDKAQAMIIAADLREAHAAAQKASATAGSEPAASETHPLPTEAPEDAPEPTAPAPSAELLDLVDAARMIAGDIQQDGLLQVLNASKAYIVEYGVAQFDLLKQVVAGEKTVQAYDPAERRLLLAAIELSKPGVA